MTNPLAVTVARDEAYQKIGRNVVLLQKMEAMLKALLTVSSYSHPVSKLSENVSKRASEIGAYTLGQAVERAAKALKAKPPAPPGYSITEPWISFSISFEGKAWGINDWRKEMRQVVKDRNHLIHQAAASLNPNSFESCKALSVEVDKQWNRVQPAYNELSVMYSSIGEYRQFMSDNIDEIVERLRLSASPHDA